LHKCGSTGTPVPPINSGRPTILDNFFRQKREEEEDSDLDIDLDILDQALPTTRGGSERKNATLLKSKAGGKAGEVEKQKRVGMTRRGGAAGMGLEPGSF